MNLPARVNSAATAMHLKWLWLKWSWPFRWAHKPLCDRFRHDVLRLGRLHVCRSCVCIYSGMLAAVLTFSLAGSVVSTAWPILAAGLLASVGFSYPGWYRRWSRPVRDALRFGAGFFCVLGFLLTVDAHWPTGNGLGLLLVACWLYFFRVRGGIKSSACDGCAEVGCHSVCSGYQFQAELARGFEEEASDLASRRFTELPVVSLRK